MDTLYVAIKIVCVGILMEKADAAASPVAGESSRCHMI